MRNTNKEEKMFMAAEVTKEAYFAAMRLATMKGVHPSILVANAINAYILAEGRDSKDGTVYAAAMTIEMEVRNTRINQIKQMAAAYIDNPTEEGAEQLKIVCELCGVTMENMIDQLNKAPHITELLKETGSLSDVEMWILNRMEPGKAYAAMVILKEAKTKGFSEYLVKEAKRKLNIQSIRMSKSWFWKIDPYTENSESIPPL